MTFQDIFFSSDTHLYGAAGTEFLHKSNNEK